MMTDQTLLTLFKWNIWASERYRKTLEEVEIDTLRINTQYGDLLDLIVHTFGSYEMWYRRMNGESPQEVVKGEDFDNWSDLFATWIKYEQLVLNYILELDEKDLKEEVSYISFDGQQYTRRRRHILQHLTAHPNYHRGQISAIFKEIDGLPSLPSTDMVVYYLETGESRISDPNQG